MTVVTQRKRGCVACQIDSAYKPRAGNLRDTGKDQVESMVWVADMLRNGTGMGGN